MKNKQKKSIFSKYRVLRRIVIASYLVFLTVAASFVMPKIISKGATYLTKRRGFLPVPNEDPMIVRKD